MHITPEMLEFDLADRIRKAMRVAGLDQTELGALVGVTGSAISTWTRGRHDPAPKYLERIASATGVPLPWLTNGPTHRQPTPAEQAWMRQLASAAEETREALHDLHQALDEATQRGPDRIQTLATHLLDQLTQPEDPA